MPKHPESGFFEQRGPAPERCAICGRSGPDLAPESRPTGAAGRMFAYPLCAGCRQTNRGNGLDLAGCRRLLYTIFEHDPRRFRADLDLGPLTGIKEVGGW